jgi:predicted amidohydrolase YtcJ
MAIKNGFSLAVHAIGDRANHEVLNAFTQLNKMDPVKEGQNLRSNLRHRIEHVQLILPSDADRLSQLGVIASMQPIHATSDMAMANRFWGERAAFSYAWRELLRHGSKLAFGSDAPVESPNPFFGLHAAVTRRRADGSPGSDGWYPEQRLTVEEALHGFTKGPAFAAGMETRLGKLTAGYLADLLILDEDPFAVNPEQLRFIQPTATMIAGRWVWRSF